MNRLIIGCALALAMQACATYESDAERARREHVDALPPDARVAAELCHEADAAMRYIIGGIPRQVFYEDAFDRLAWHAHDLRTVAEHLGHPCP